MYIAVVFVFVFFSPDLGRVIVLQWNLNRGNESGSIPL